MPSTNNLIMDKIRYTFIGDYEPYLDAPGAYLNGLIPNLYRLSMDYKVKVNFQPNDYISNSNETELRNKVKEISNLSRKMIQEHESANTTDWVPSYITNIEKILFSDKQHN